MSKSPMHNTAFNVITQKYCRYFDVQSPKQFTLEQWYRVIAEGTLELVYGKPAAKKSGRHVNYLSMEFLIGRLTGNNLMNLGYYDAIKAYLANYDVALVDVLEQERDPALGNGGLGRLAACFLDSMATLGQNATGYGLHYQYGLFKQSFEDGMQKECADVWSRNSYPWHRYNPSKTQNIGFGGKIKLIKGDKYAWEPKLTIQGKAFDLPIVGYKNEVIQPLRLWQADSEQSFDLALFNDGKFLNADKTSVISERQPQSRTKIALNAAIFPLRLLRRRHFGTPFCRRSRLERLCEISSHSVERHPPDAGYSGINARIVR